MSVETEQEKAQRLDNSELFDVHTWSDYSEVNNAVNYIRDIFTRDPKFTGNKKKQRRHIKVVILDLYVKWLKDPEMYSSVSRRKGHYTELDNRYNKLYIKHKNITKIIDYLEKNSYLEQIKGHYDRTGEYSSHITRIRATDKLITLIKDDFEITPEMVERSSNTECIILRDYNEEKKRQEDIGYLDNKTTISMRAELYSYNNLLRTTFIDVPSAPEQGIPSRKSNKKKTKLNQYDKFVRRIFNNDDFDQGGRYYGGWWQRIPSEWRARIWIGGTPASELDYSGLHIILLYAMEGVDYWKEINKDPYSVSGYDTSERMRDIFKQVLLISINSKSKKATVKAIRSEINKNKEDYDWLEEEGITLDYGELIDQFAEIHSRISGYFFSDIGVKLQNLDSIIATKVINALTAEGIPVLCIHDSFVISTDKAEQLQTLMDQKFEETLRDLDINIDVSSLTKGSGLGVGEWQVLLSYPDYRDRMIDLLTKTKYDYPDWNSRLEEFNSRELEADYYGSEPDM